MAEAVFGAGFTSGLMAASIIDLSAVSFLLRIRAAFRAFRNLAIDKRIRTHASRMMPSSIRNFVERDAWFTLVSVQRYA